MNSYQVIFRTALVLVCSIVFGCSSEGKTRNDVQAVKREFPLVRFDSVASSTDVKLDTEAMMVSISRARIKAPSAQLEQFIRDNAGLFKLDSDDKQLEKFVRQGAGIDWWVNSATLKRGRLYSSSIVVNTYKNNRIFREQYKIFVDDDCLWVFFTSDPTQG